ncbi:MAG: hypothetical protein GF355_16270 [Candidatus Eisenbacteria bacterium]|nr:hypothetical protein [Candidatus Eisenbacteria bacterium]
MRIGSAATLAAAVVLAAAAGGRAAPPADASPAAAAYHRALELDRRPAIIEAMQEIRERWPKSEAAGAARRWLVEDGLTAGGGFRPQEGRELLAELHSADTLAFRRKFLTSWLAYRIDAPAGSTAVAVESDAVWDFLAVWYDARRRWRQAPGEEAWHAYLALEGEARRRHLFGYWLAALCADSERADAVELARDLWGRNRGALEGTLEGAWITRALREAAAAP